MWRAAPSTYKTKRDAQAFLAATRADIERGTWVAPETGRVPLRQYAEQWLEQKRPTLRPRSYEGYEANLRLHILPKLGNKDLSKLEPGAIRAWRAELLAAGKPGAPTIAKCYRLLHAVLATALEDELIQKNPCVLRGASTERPAERPVVTVQQVYAIADAMGPSYRLMALLAAFTGLRLGELRALRRDRVDVADRTLKVVEQYQELSNGQLVLGPPKTDAGQRTVSIPEVVMPDLLEHLATYAGPGPHGLLFCGRQHQPIRRKSFYRHWNRATEAAGVTGFHFHDLRHTGNTLAAATGASTKELMSRMGHASARAAIMYQHASRERDAALANALSELIVKNAATPVGAKSE